MTGMLPTSPCSKCGGPRDTGHPYCRSCKSAYMRTWNKNHYRPRPRLRADRDNSPPDTRWCVRCMIEKQKGAFPGETGACCAVCQRRTDPWIVDSTYRLRQLAQH